MTLFEQWELVNYIANKDYEGNVITPERFKQLVKVANMDLFKIKMGLPEEYQPGMPISRQYFEANQLLADETKFLKVFNSSQTVQNGVISYPSNYFRFDDMRYAWQREVDGETEILRRPVEMLFENEYSDRAGNWTKRPTVKHPVCVLRKDGIYVYPTVITSVEFSYVKYPAEPIFDYDTQPGYITEGSNPTEYEWPEILHMDLTRIILGYIGINLREQQLQQYAEQHKAQGV